MKLNKSTSIVFALTAFLSGYAAIANAESYSTNNSGPQNPPQQAMQQPQQQMQPQQPQQPNCAAASDMGTSTDPRVPPAGVYTSKNSDGSTNTLYTTGDKKPYYVDNPCSNNATANNNAQQPMVIVQPNLPRR